MLAEHHAALHRARHAQQPRASLPGTRHLRPPLELPRASQRAVEVPERAAPRPHRVVHQHGEAQAALQLLLLRGVRVHHRRAAPVRHLAVLRQSDHVRRAHRQPHHWRERVVRVESRSLDDLGGLHGAARVKAQAELPQVRATPGEDVARGGEQDVEGLLDVDGQNLVAALGRLGRRSREQVLPAAAAARCLEEGRLLALLLQHSGVALLRVQNLRAHVVEVVLVLVLLQLGRERDLLEVAAHDRHAACAGRGAGLAVAYFSEAARRGCGCSRSRSRSSAVALGSGDFEFRVSMSTWKI